MLITEVILRLRAECDLFERRVGGTAKFSSVTAAGVAEDLDVPCAFVVPLDEFTDPKDNEQATSTWVTERIGVIVCVSNSVDRSDGNGVSASDMIKLAGDQIYGALEAHCPTLVGGSPPALQLSPEANLNDPVIHEHFYEDILSNSHYGRFMYESSQHLSMTPARLWHEFEYSIRYQKDKIPALRDLEGLMHLITKIYGGFSPEIGLAHIDDYELLVDVSEE